MKHKKAKLLRKLMRGGAVGAVVSDKVKAEETISLSEVMDIFNPVLEELTDALAGELRVNGMPLENLEELREMNLKYNRARNSFMSEPEGFGDFADNDDDEPLFDLRMSKNELPQFYEQVERSGSVLKSPKKSDENYKPRKSIERFA
jgi:hypothetical protein